MCECVCVWVHVWARCFSNFLCAPFSWLLAKLWVACVALSLHIYIKQSCTSSLYLQLCICHFTLSLSGIYQDLWLLSFLSTPPPPGLILYCFSPVMCPVVCLCVPAVFLRCFYFEMPDWRCYSFTSILILLWIRIFFRQPMRLTYLTTLSLRLALKFQFTYFLNGYPERHSVRGLTQNSWHLLLTCWFVLYVSPHLRLSSLSADILILRLLL